MLEAVTDREAAEIPPAACCPELSKAILLCCKRTVALLKAACNLGLLQVLPSR